jgi:O-antigen biosynthesis protein
VTHIAVCTPLHNTPPDVLARTWASLKNQTHTDWTWWIWDDSTNNEAWRQLWGMCADERYRIQPMRGMSNIGVIGEVKRRLMMAADGDILVELDHDDELTPDALTEIEQALAEPGVDFCYSDWCEINPQGEWCRYPDGWAFGYGDQYKLDDRWVMRAPEINGTTMRHIVSAPNHVRAWNADLYREIGGHDPTLPVADDYELCVRTFLNTKMTHIPKLLYKQHIGGHTAQRQRNALIQQLVAEISDRYRGAITDRCVRLGLPTGL